MKNPKQNGEPSTIDHDSRGFLLNYSAKPWQLAGELQTIHERFAPESGLQSDSLLGTAACSSRSTVGSALVVGRTRWPIAWFDLVSNRRSKIAFLAPVYGS